MVIALVAFAVGIGVGALVNQLASDLPGRGRVTEPHCPYCGSQRRWSQWSALLAYVTGQADCSSCGAPVRLRQPLVEIALGFIYSYLWMAVGPSVELLFYALYSAVFVLILITDLERRLILDVVTYPAMILGLIGSFFMPGVTWWSALIGGAIGLTFFFIAAIIGNVFFGAGAMGGGDVKLAAFIGIITGYPLVIEAIVLTLLVGAAVSLVLLITGVRSMRDYVPYGPFLIAGGMATLLWGYRIVGWFFI